MIWQTGFSLLLFLFAFGSFGSFASTADAAAPADLVLRGGKIITLDKTFGVVQALAVRRDRILAVGTNKEIAQHVGPRTQVLELRGRLVVPGFIESHGHFTSLGQARMMLDLTRANSWREIIQQVESATRTTPAGEWILGRGWHQSKWKRKPTPHVEGYPVHTALSKVTPRHPVLLIHASGHMCFANAQAMKLANITRATPNPHGGQILKDARGEPTGIFRETAQDRIRRAHLSSQRRLTAQQRKRQLLRAIELATEECLRKGVTSFQDAGSSFATIDLFKELARQKKLKVRLWVMARTSNAELKAKLGIYRMVGFGNHHLTVRAIKRAIDGALGPHGAWLLQPYEDLPTSTGLNTASLASIKETARLAIQHDYQLCVHAIGDRANREILDIFEQAFRKQPHHVSLRSKRWRIEHAQHLHPRDIPRFGKLGVIASMQGIHCTSDAVFVIKRLGFRRAQQGAYVWQSLLKSGAVICNGTDTPVEDIDPIACFHASTTRRLPNGSTFFGAQKMTRLQALRSYTSAAAYAAFEEKLKGTLTPGKLADLVVLSRDITTVADKDIRRAQVLYTIVGGKLVYQRSK